MRIVFHAERCRRDEGSALVRLHILEMYSWTNRVPLAASVLAFLSTEAHESSAGNQEKKDLRNVDNSWEVEEDSSEEEG